MSDNITLYHGSKSGLNGTIKPISREKCAFGKGFYMGTDKMQPLTLISNYPNATLYTLSVDLTGLKILDMPIGINWAILVAFYRGKMNDYIETDIYKQVKAMADGYDMIVGYIANDRMYVVLERFFNGEITDTALINSLSALKLGRQYVAITEKACRQIEVVSEHNISDADREIYIEESFQNRMHGIALADEMCRKYRRDGRFFDEILKDGGLL